MTRRQKAFRALEIKSIARYAPDCDAVGLIVASTGQYYTPHVTFC